MVIGINGFEAVVPRFGYDKKTGLPNRVGSGQYCFELLISLHKIDNCILTPHVASATVEVREQMGIDAAENIIAIFRGKKPLKIVNPEVYS